MAFYKEAFYDDTSFRREILSLLLRGGGRLPTFPAELALRYEDQCDFTRLGDILSAVLTVYERYFPPLGELFTFDRPRHEVNSCEFEFDGFAWKAQIEHGAAINREGNLSVFVNIRMPNDGFVYLQPSHSKISEHFDASLAPVSRHDNIPYWHRTNGLPGGLASIACFFGNWMLGLPNLRDLTTTGDVPDIRVQGWYNEIYNRFDLDLFGTVSGRSCKWSLSFEQWCPVQDSETASGRRQFITFHDAQAKAQANAKAKGHR